MTGQLTGTFAGDPSQLPAWQALTHLAETVGRTPIATLLDEPGRSTMEVAGAGLTLDFTRQRVDAQVIKTLLRLADECGLPAARDAMFAGSHINATEDRAVGHVALRLPRTDTFMIDGTDVVPEIWLELDAMTAFAEGVRTGGVRSITGERFRSIINIGIGGSDLGPAMAYQALREFADPALTFRFVSNVDPTDVERALHEVDPMTTLIIVSSKTFTTSETMANAARARSWLTDALGVESVGAQMVAISTNHEAIQAFGITRHFGFWDWVGGRYSVDSAIGLSTMIAIGPKQFRAMLDGFHAMDVHFSSTPGARNLPMLMGLLDVWNRTFLNIATVAVLPYSHGLSRFPAYVQQLAMESNGKSVRLDGTPCEYNTGAIYWGEPGTNGQHSFHQLLHQGTSDVACQIICFAKSPWKSQGQHDLLIANALAQASVLARGRPLSDIADGSRHKVMPGNRPTSVLWGSQLDPFTLGALISAYEHAVFVQSAIWGINAFDQWGVELGKTMAQAIASGFHDPDSAAVDPITRASMHLYERLRNG